MRLMQIILFHLVPNCLMVECHPVATSLTHRVQIWNCCARHSNMRSSMTQVGVPEGFVPPVWIPGQGSTFPPSHSSRPQQFLSAVKNICRPATHNREKKIIKKCQNMFYFANEFRHVKSAFYVIELLCHVIWADKSKLLLLSLLPMTMK